MRSTRDMDDLSRVVASSRSDCAEPEDLQVFYLSDSRVIGFHRGWSWEDECSWVASPRSTTMGRRSDSELLGREGRATWRGVVSGCGRGMRRMEEREAAMEKTKMGQFDATYIQTFHHLVLPLPLIPTSNFISNQTKDYRSALPKQG